MDIYEQQGGDITASDMIVPEDDSDIRRFYKGSTIFVTGATGYLGKLCVEKLLRTCPELDKIYVLVRPKRGKDIKTRLEQMFHEPTFEPLKRKNPDFQDKIHPVFGDIACPMLGMNEQDIEKLVLEVDCIFHYAATVKFDEKIGLATRVNVGSVIELISLAKRMKKLRAFLYVSTAYSNCNHKEIEETFYKPPITGEKLMKLIDCLNDNQLDAITTTILGDFPNTYTFTKCVAEDVIRNEGKKLPIAVYRPSIVIGTANEPVAGWTDSIYGATGVLLGVAIGLLRSIYGRRHNKADMVPADYVVNSCLAVAWDVATMKTLNDNKEIQDMDSREEKFDKEAPVYNYVSTVQNPLTWKKFTDLAIHHCKQIPSEKVLWHYMFKMRSIYLHHVLAVFFLHTLPAYFVDAILVCLGKKPLLVKAYRKVNKFGDVLSYFTLNEWIFKNDNIQALWKRMKKQDKENFEFDIERLNWDRYFYTYSRGVRVYLLKDPLETVPQGTVKYYKMKIAHYTVITIFWLLVYKLCMLLLSIFF